MHRAVVPLLLSFLCACGARTSLVLEDEDGGGAACGGWGGPCCHSRCGAGLICTQGTCVAADAGPPQPSCAPAGAGLTNCGGGDAGAGEASCCESLEVPAGTFYRTYTNSGSGPTAQADPATVSGFRLDKYEVTVGRFRTFFAAWTAGWRPAAGSGKHVHLNGGLGLANGASPGSFEAGWTGPSASDIAPDRSNEREVPLTDATLACSDGIIDDLGGSRFDTWTPSVGPNENRPVNCIDWHDAYAFCIWDGGFLPSEAEWEYAAAGGAEQRAYAWGSTPPGIANDFEIYECHFPRGRRGHLDACASNGNIAPVGTAREGAGRWGQLDLLGNLSEYALDFWNESYVNPCTDCGYLYPTPGVATPGITIRGGSFDAKDYMPPSRNFNGRVYRNTSLGFRCARTP